VRDDLPTGTVTFLFTDVEGSTKLLHELGAEAYAAELAEHRRVIREACAAEEGVEVDTQGDAFFFAFPSAPGAMFAAAAMTEALAAGLIQVRVGLHTGSPLLTEQGYVGDDVHLAARIAASAHGGQVVASSATAELVGFQLTDLGEHRLKDMQEAVSIYQLGGNSFPPLKTISNMNLPRPASSFVGREDELQEVLARIEQGARLVTLTGPGGTGKTRLALQAASSLVPAYKAGVFWVGLASLRDPALVTETIAHTLGAKDGLAEHVGERELLLLLDNMEHVIEAAPKLSALLTACPNLTLLVTSRELLRVQGEVEYPVPPLAEPEAVSLFCDRSALEPSGEIAELCVRLDSLPLAVELAAARTKALSPAQILERFSQRLDLLEGGRDADPRQRTLRATIEWSYNLLSEEEQLLFGRLSVFAGGCSFEAAEQVGKAEIDGLQSLVEKSLLRFMNERYWMLETIREFADEQLDDRTTRDLRQRHAEYFVALAEEAEPHLRGDAREWLDRIEAEHDNLRSALDYLDATGDPLQLRLVAGIQNFWVVHGHASEGRRRLAQALAAAPPESVDARVRALQGASELARIQGDYEAATSHSRLGLDLARSISDWYGVGAALQSLSNIAIEEGNVDTASELLDEALEPLRLANDTRALAIATSTRGYIALIGGDLDEAAALCAESFGLASEIGNEEGMTLALLNGGFASLGMDRLDEALAAFARALKLAAGLGYRDWIAYAQEGIAAVSVARGRTDRALRLIALAAAMRGEIGTKRDPVEQKIYDKTLEAIDESFAREAIDAAFAEARQSTIDEAVAYALESRE
jgi:predicted ATPase